MEERENCHKVTSGWKEEEDEKNGYFLTLKKNHSGSRDRAPA
jgi:hypothetical protein